MDPMFPFIILAENSLNHLLINLLNLFCISKTVNLAFFNVTISFISELCSAPLITFIKLEKEPYKQCETIEIDFSNIKFRLDLCDIVLVVCNIISLNLCKF